MDNKVQWLDLPVEKCSMLGFMVAKYITAITRFNENITIIFGVGRYDAKVVFVHNVYHVLFYKPVQDYYAGERLALDVAYRLEQETSDKVMEYFGFKQN